MNMCNMMGKLHWECTDPDTPQYCSKESEHSWFFAEIREVMGNRFMVSVDRVDLFDFSLDEIRQSITGYYDSLEQIVADYGFREALRIMAECIFEERPIGDMDFNIECRSMGSAIKKLHDLMKA